VDQQDQPVRQAQLAQQDLPVLVDQQVLKAQLDQQDLHQLFLDQQDQPDRKVLQLTLEDQLQLQQIFLRLATLLMTRTSLTLTAIFTSGTVLPGRVLDRSLDRKDLLVHKVQQDRQVQPRR
jgi:hypothetical protein